MDQVDRQRIIALSSVCPPRGVPRSVLFAILIMDSDEDNVWPTQEDLGEFVGFSTRATRNAIKVLEDAGVIARYRGGRSFGRDSYRINYRLLEDRLQEVIKAPPGSGIEPNVVAVMYRDGFKCRYCGRPDSEVQLHIDHVVPRSKGGPDEMHNLAAACQSCNSSKGNRDLDEWRAHK